MIRIEILEIIEGKIKAAFYYPVPDDVYSPASEDQSRNPTGGKLSNEEKQLLKDGKLVEHIIFHQINGRNKTVIQNELVALWNSEKQTVRNRYIGNYNFSGKTWDGNDWN